MAASRIFVSRLFSQTAAVMLTKIGRFSAGIQRINFVEKSRSLHTSQSIRIKEIRESVTGNVTVIEGVHVDSNIQDRLVKLDDDASAGACPLCRLNLQLEHTDVLILSQFVRDDGCLLSRRVTGLCEKQQKLVKALVAQAQKAGLMSNLTPSYSHKDPKKRYKWKKFNRYFEPEKSGKRTKQYM